MDDGWYMMVAIKSFNNLSESIPMWYRQLFNQLPQKSPFIWFGSQFFTPIGQLLGSVKTGLISMNVIIFSAAIVFMYRTVSRLNGQLLIGLIAAGFLAASPLLNHMATELWREPSEVFVVVMAIYLLVNCRDMELTRLIYLAILLICLSMLVKVFLIIALFLPATYIAWVILLRIGSENPEVDWRKVLAAVVLLVTALIFGLVRHVYLVILISILFSYLFSTKKLNLGIFSIRRLLHIGFFFIIIFTLSYFWINAEGIYQFVQQAAYGGYYDDLGGASFLQRLNNWWQTFYIEHFFPLWDSLDMHRTALNKVSFVQKVWMAITIPVVICSIIMTKGHKRIVVAICLLQLLLLFLLYSYSKSTVPRFVAVFIAYFAFIFANGIAALKLRGISFAVIALLCIQLISLWLYRYGMIEKSDNFTYCCPVNEHPSYNDIIESVLTFEGMDNNDLLYTNVNYTINKHNTVFLAYEHGLQNPRRVHSLEYYDIETYYTELDFESHLKSYLDDWDQYEDIFLLGFQNVDEAFNLQSSTRHYHQPDADFGKKMYRALLNRFEFQKVDEFEYSSGTYELYRLSKALRE